MSASNLVCTVKSTGLKTTIKRLNLLYQRQLDGFFKYRQRFTLHKGNNFFYQIKTGANLNQDKCFCIKLFSVE
jgi:hypothetical protein